MDLGITEEFCPPKLCPPRLGWLGMGRIEMEGGGLTIDRGLLGIDRGMDWRLVLGNGLIGEGLVGND